MTNAENGEFTELLNAVAGRPYEECEAEWKKLLKRLRLDLYYVLPVQEVLRQGRWKGKAYPMGYVRTAAVRTAVRMGLVDVRPPENMEVLASELAAIQECAAKLGRVPSSKEMIETTRIGRFTIKRFFPTTQRHCAPAGWNAKAPDANCPWKSCLSIMPPRMTADQANPKP